MPSASFSRSARNREVGRQLVDEVRSRGVRSAERALRLAAGASRDDRFARVLEQLLPAGTFGELLARNPSLDVFSSSRRTR